MRIVVFLVLFLLASTGQATSVFAVPLERMAKSAHIIFYGRVTANETRLDEANQVATYTQFEVLDVVRGQVASSHTIKQFGGRLPGSDIVVEIRSIPKFSVGQEFVVFLPKPSRSGFSSPMGLSQGAYIVKDTLAGKIVGNGRAMDSLISPKMGINIKSLSGRPDKAKLTDFLTAVRAMAAP